MNRIRAAVSLTTIVIAGFALAACGNSSNDASHGGMDSNGDHMMDGSSTSMMHGSMAGHMSNSAVPAGARTIDVTAKSFGFTPRTITVKAGEPIEIRLTSADVLHDLTAPKLDLHVAAKGSKPAVGGFTAKTPGMYTFYCSVSGHRQAGMQGTIVVTAA